MMQNSSILETLTGLSAAKAAELIRQKEISPVELLDAYLARIDQVGPAINAFATECFEKARKQARLAESAVVRGGVDAPLLGVPVTVKSCFDVEGLRCEAGSLLRQGHIPTSDAAVVTSLRRAGAIILGNTCTPEMLMAYDTESRLHGRTNNPWDAGRSAGGSSGGEAAAIAAGMSAAGIGSDGGGSIRVPAHFCGICGLKPTPGRISSRGHFPPGLGPFSFTGVVGPMARTIADLQLLLQALEGYDPGDAAAYAPGERESSKPVESLRIGFFEDNGIATPVPEIREAVQVAATTLAREGFYVEPIRPAWLMEACELWAAIFIDAGAILLRPMVAQHEAEVSETLRDFLAFAAGRPPLTAERLLKTLLARDQLRLRVLAEMDEFPIILSPVCSIPAFKHSDGGWSNDRPACYPLTMTYCQPYNLLGNPAAVLPVSHAGALPVGVQIAGRPYKDHEVLAVAEVLDRVFGWKNPPL
jgi:Asp-tRNA(Asn)/Glu-tRNA(Gln) amidotransferase A subunit family amidase